MLTTERRRDCYQVHKRSINDSLVSIVGNGGVRMLFLVFTQDQYGVVQAGSEPGAPYAQASEQTMGTIEP